MKKKKLWKDIKKCFSNSKGRFISIFSLMMLGSFALVGLKVTGPNIRETGTHYFKDQNLSDITVIGDYGIDEENQKAMNQLSGTEKIEYGYLKDVEIKGSTEGLRLFSSPETISNYNLSDGRNARKDNEIVLSDTYANQYKIGDTIQFIEKETITGEKVLKRHSFSVVGFAKSPEFLSSINMGQSTSGSGELKGYGFVNDTVFDADYYMLARITFKDTKELNPYSDKYTDIIQKHKNELDKLVKDQPGLRLKKIKQEYQRQIDDGQSQIDKAKQKLSDTKEQLANAGEQIEKAKTKIHASDTQLEKAQKQLASGQTQLNKKWTQLQSAKQALESAKVTLQETETQLNTAHQAIIKGRESIKAADSEISVKETELVRSIKTIAASEKKLEEKTAEFHKKQQEYNSAYTAFSQKKHECESALSSCRQMIDSLTGQLANPYISDEEKEKINQKLTAAKEELKKLKAAETTLDKKEKELNDAKQELDNSKLELERADEKLNTARQELSENETQLIQAKQAISKKKQLLKQKEAQYNSGYLKYQEGISSYNQSLNKYYNGLSAWKDSFQTLSSKQTEYKKGLQKLETVKQELAEKENEYKSGLEKFNEKKDGAENQINKNEEKLADAKESMNNLTLPVYSLNTRREVPGSEGYRIYDTISVIIDSLANVFPIFLYLVAALVTLTTMTRFVDEERMNSGTLKALGYTDADVMKKFTVYGLISGLSGTFAGIFLGHILVPLIVYNAYGQNFDIPSIELHFYPKAAMTALFLAVVSAVVPACMAAYRELKEKPSVLLLPKPPAKGSNIFLEHIKTVWNKMSFTHKVTARNIFRYKKRMLMTIFGVCGAVTLLFAGFSVQNSISGINDKQFGEIIKYDLIVAQNQNLTEEKQKKIDSLLDSESVKQQLPVYYESISKVAGKNHDKQEIKLIVTDNESKFDEYICLKHRKSQTTIDLQRSDGAVISERLAKLLNVDIGDSFTISSANDQEHTVKVTDITEMYTGHFMFMNHTYYEKSFSKKYKPNANLVILNHHSTENARVQAEKFMGSDSVKGVVQNITLTNQIDTIVRSLNKVMTVLIIVAVLLAVVILYNLTNINIAERIRELSTIKVLGFYDKEVTMYIYRETIILSLFGILAGFGLGDGLYRYILAVVPPDEVMFNPVLGAKAFVIPVLLIAVITVILGCIMNRKLKKLDMLSALKSME